jgi:hypothetical protein
MDIFSPYVFSHHIHVTFDAVKTTIILYESRSSSAASRLRRGVDVRRGHASVISLEGLFKARFEPRTRTLRYSAKLNRIQRNDTELLPRLCSSPSHISLGLSQQANRFWTCCPFRPLAATTPCVHWDFSGLQIIC